MPEEPVKNQDKDVNASDEVKKVADTDKRTSVAHVGPSAMTPDHNPRPWLQARQGPHKRKGLMIAAVVTAVLFVLGVGGWLTYALWYQNPDKVVMDAMVNAIRSETVVFEGSMASKTGDLTFSAKINGKYGHKEGASGNAKMAFEAEGAKINMDVDGVQTANGDNYVRVKDVDKLYDLFDDALIKGVKIDASSSGYTILKEFLNSVLKPTAEKINDKWIKFSIKDLKKINAQLAEQFECTQSVFKKLQGNTDQLIELGSVYQNNRFLQVKKNLGNSDNYFRFEIGVINDKLKDFAEALTKTKLYKELQDCSPTSKNPLDIDASDIASSSDASVEVWIDQWSHQLHKINAKSTVENDGKKGTLTLALTTKFNDRIEVVAPKEGILSFDEAFSEISEYFSGLVQLGLSASQNRI